MKIPKGNFKYKVNSKLRKKKKEPLHYDLKLSQVCVLLCFNVCSPFKLLRNISDLLKATFKLLQFFSLTKALSSLDTNTRKYIAIYLFCSKILVMLQVIDHKFSLLLV